MSKNEVATIEEDKKAVAVLDYGDESGSGFETMTNDDMSVPFLAILQSNSPQVEEKDPEGAEPGKLFNTVTRELTAGDQGVVFLPVHFERAYVEWVPRNKGGGFVGLHDPESDVVKKAIEDNDGKKFGKLHVGDNELIETKYMYGLVLDDAGKEVQGFAVISFTSTKIKPFNDWVTGMRLVKGKPPMFANRARLKTVKQKNEHGTFHNFRIEPLHNTWADSLIHPKDEADLLTEAREFRKLVTSGMARAAFETERAAGAGTPAEESEEAPF